MAMIRYTETHRGLFNNPSYKDLHLVAEELRRDNYYGTCVSVEVFIKDAEYLLLEISNSIYSVTPDKSIRDIIRDVIKSLYERDIIDGYIFRRSNLEELCIDIFKRKTKFTDESNILKILFQKIMNLMNNNK